MCALHLCGKSLVTQHMAPFWNALKDAGIFWNQEWAALPALHGISPLGKHDSLMCKMGILIVLAI